MGPLDRAEWVLFEGVVSFLLEAQSQNAPSFVRELPVQ